MAWSKRNGKRFWYTSRRGANGFEKEYLGSGPIAELAATATAFNQVRRNELRLATRAELEYGTVASGAIHRLNGWCDFLIDARTWIGRERTRGLRQGRWRTMADTDGSTLADTCVFQDLRRVVVAANGGDVAARSELCQLLDKQSGLWQCVADLAGRAEDALIRLASGGEALLTESLRRRVAEMKQELGGNSPTPLQRLLTERLVALWLHLQIAETALSVAESKAENERCHRTLALANRQFLEATQVVAAICPASVVHAPNLYNDGSLSTADQDR